MWIVLGLVLLMCCLPTVESEGCFNTGIIIGQRGKEVVFKFSIPALYEIYIISLDEKLFIQNDFTMQDLEMYAEIRFRTKNNSMIENVIYKNGKPTYIAGNLTEIFMMNDTLVVKKTKLQKGDAGIYSIYFKLIPLLQKALIIADKPTIKGRSSPNPVLKPEDNYTTTIQLECDSVSTSVGDCLPTLYIVWYKNGKRMTDVDPTLSHINMTVDRNGGNFTCLATDYPPCFRRLQSTQKHFDDIEECNNNSESETFIVKPEYVPIDVKLDPDNREITVNKSDDLKVRCSAECHPKCDIRWEKDVQGFVSNGLVNLAENSFENDLIIKNVNSSYEGVYVCLVNNIHGEVKKSFILNVKVSETENQEMVSVLSDIVTVAVIIVIVIVIVILITVITFINYPKPGKKALIYKIMKINLYLLGIVALLILVLVIVIAIQNKKYPNMSAESFNGLFILIAAVPVLVAVFVIIIEVALYKKYFLKLILRKLKPSEDEVTRKTQDDHQDGSLLESRGEGISKTKDEHHDTSLESRYEDACATIDVHHDTPSLESRYEDACATIDVHQNNHY